MTIAPALVPVLAAAAQAATGAGPAQAPVPIAAPGLRHVPGDPLEKWNRRFFRGYQKADRRVLGPVARGYAHAVPKPVRYGLRNFFSNLGEPLVFLSYLIELKPGKAAETAGRFLINSTLGIGGLADVAKAPKVNLPHRPNSFSDALGYYGVKPGPFLFLPLVGPTSLRDLLGGQAEASILPFAVGTPFDRAEYQVTRAVTSGLEARAESDADLKALLADAVDPYATFRSVWMQDRQGEIDALHGHAHAKVNAPELAEPLADPAGTQGPPSSKAPELNDPLADPAAASTTATPPAPAAPPPDAKELQDPLKDPAATP
jgi:phospholipid-binding lipoprotein MlaA